MKRNFEPEIVALINAGMPKEIIVKYFSYELPEGHVNVLLRRHTVLSFEKSIPSMFKLLTNDSIQIPDINIGKLKMYVREVLKIEIIETSLMYAHYVLIRLEKLRYANDVDESYKKLIDDINRTHDSEFHGGGEDLFDKFIYEFRGGNHAGALLGSNDSIFGRFIHEVRGGYIDFSKVPKTNWPESFIIHLIKSTDDKRMDYIPVLEKGVEKQIDVVITEDLFDEEVAVVKRYYGLLDSTPLTIEEISNLLDLSNKQVKGYLLTGVEKLRRARAIKTYCA